MKKTAGYIRVSTEEQAKKYGLNVQREKIKAYCELYGYENLKWYEDDTTGKNINRPGLQKLLKDVEDGKIERVIVFKADRLSRKLRDLLAIIEDVFEPQNCAFISISEQFDTSTPTGKAFLQMLGTFAELERNTIVYRTTSGRVQKAKEGGHACGSLPFGYRNNSGTLEKEPEEMEIVKAIFAMRSDGMSFRAIARRLNKDGVPTKRGGKWHDSTVRYLVKNPKYKGLDIYHFKTFDINETIVNKKMTLAIV